MEKIKKIRKASLKKSFIYAMFSTITIIVLLSSLTIWGCIFLQNIIMPDSDYVILKISTTYEDGSQSINSQRMKFGSNEEMAQLIPDVKDTDMAEPKGITNYSIDKVENSYMSLSPKRKIAYSILSFAIVALPAMYSILGIVICAMWFYKEKLDRPIKILLAATDNIVNENLDFSIECNSTDEMGRLCDSFEMMRKTLYENNRVLWNMLEERRMLQASVAHDLRNPIAIIEGYTEYLQQNIPAGSLTEEKLLHTVSNLSKAAKRLERYTDSIRDIHHLEDIEVHRTKNILPDLLMEMSDDFIVMAKQENLTLEISNSVPKCEVMIDKQVLYRILENIFTNALRFAQNFIQITFFLDGSMLVAYIQDDGKGFSDEILKKRDRYPLWIETSGQHMGMGLVISRILCKKHGGELKLSNAFQSGALVEVRVSVQ